jgi:Arginine/lysine/ornithine decarboxylases
LDKHRAPLYERLIEHRSRRAASFHVPGHKNGATIPQPEGLQALMELDYTEITGLDDLHQPEGVIREAELLAAECYGADRTFFLVQGSTLGNLAMILSVCRPGDLILVDRFVHKSVLNGLMLAHARAVFLTPVWDPLTGYAAGIDMESFRETLHRYPEAKAVMLTRPNYFGYAADLSGIIDEAHRAGLAVLVDEAHGAHFGFHEAVPVPALSLGADAVVQSTHKMLSALTMGAMLHVQGGRIDAGSIARTIRMLQTSSPSYPIMATLDVARRLVHTHGRDLLEQGLAAVRRFVDAMGEMPWYVLPNTLQGSRDDDAARFVASAGQAGDEDLCSRGPNQTNPMARTRTGAVRDPFKQPVRDGTGTLTGYELQELLEQHGCMVEMADPQHVLLVFSPFSSSADSERIVQIFRHIAEQYQLDKKELVPTLTNNNILPLIPASIEPIQFSRHMMNPEEADEVPLALAAGEYSADMLIPYPPGIPFVYPGEQLTEELIHILKLMSGKGARFQGGMDSSLSKVRIVRRRLEAHERMT